MGIRVGDLATARSGDKGRSANIGVVALDAACYAYLARHLTAERVEGWFAPLGAKGVTRHDLPKLAAFNFLLPGVLGLGGSRSLRVDAQGKALGQALLACELPDDGAAPVPPPLEP